MLQVTNQTWKGHVIQDILVWYFYTYGCLFKTKVYCLRLLTVVQDKYICMVKVT